MGTRKNLSVIYRQFGHAPSKMFASPVVVCLRLGMQVLKMLNELFPSLPSGFYLFIHDIVGPYIV